MSWSPCFNCKAMVSCYEKYCTKCEKKYRQDESFWKVEPDAYQLYSNPILRVRELDKDRLDKDGLVK